ncbi:MAG: nuclear transport factor 2 family protein [Novosphingobium sp.]
MSQELGGRLQRLEDIQAIQVVKWRYLRACDDKNPERVRACFTVDALIDYEGFPVFRERDAFVRGFEKMGCVPHLLDMHHGQNPVVEVNGDTARGWFDLLFFQIDTQARRQTQLAIAYDDSFVRQDDGQWLIARTVCRRRSMLVRELGEDALERVILAARSDHPGEAAPPRG